jgi:hypothetical protein
MGVHYATDELKAVVARLDDFRAEYGTVDRPFEVQAAVLDQLPTPEVCEDLEKAGVTTLITSAWMMEGLTNAPLDANIAAIERFGERYIAPLRGG